MTALDRSSDVAALAGVAELLWPGTTTATTRARGGGDDYLVLPSLARPRLVVPVAHAPTAGLVLGHGGAGHHPARVALRRVAARAITASGVHRAVPLPRVVGSGPTWLLDEVQALVADARGLGLRLGTVRPNRKPVALVADAHGRLVAVGKIGWSPLTRDLVDTIDRRLRAVGEVDGLLVPRPLGRSDHAGHLVHWQSPLPLERAAPPTPQVLAAGLEAITHLGPRAHGPLGDSTYASVLAERADAVGHPGIVDALATVLGRHGDVDLETGAWHGDLTPWNVAQVGDRLAVWDWERTRDGVPVGLDAAHYHLSLAGLTVDGAAELRRATAAAEPLLAHLGVHGRAVDAVQDLHLLELLLRLADHPPASGLVATMLSLLVGMRP